MSTIIDKLKDKLGNFVLPITNTKAVYDDAGNRLDNTLNGLTEKIGFSYSVSGNDYKQVIENIIAVAISRYGDSFDTITGTGDWQGINWTYITLTKKGGVIHGIFHIADGKLIAFSKVDGQSINITNDYANNKAISDAYDPSKTYLAGQYCIYNNMLWRSLLDNNLANTPSEGTYWTTTSVSKNLITKNGEGKFGYLGADDSFIPFKSGEEPVLLWENPNPNAAFASGTRINLDLSPYSAVLIEIKAETTKDYTSNGLINYVPMNNPVSSGGTGLISQYIDTSNVRIRRLTAIDNNGMTFGNGLQPYGTVSNSYGIPTRIWGVPTEFVVPSAETPLYKEITLTTEDQFVDCGFTPSRVAGILGAGDTTYFCMFDITPTSTIASRVGSASSIDATTRAIVTFLDNGINIKAQSTSYIKKTKLFIFK